MVGTVFIGSLLTSSGQRSVVAAIVGDVVVTEGVDHAAGAYVVTLRRVSRYRGLSEVYRRRRPSGLQAESRVVRDLNVRQIYVGTRVTRRDLHAAGGVVRDSAVGHGDIDWVRT